MRTDFENIIVGGGASGFFTAANLSKEIGVRTAILEKGTSGLQKVKVSGGGRCNVTHACFEPQMLVENYPRGIKELLGLFYGFDCGSTMEWFENRGVSLKIEGDGRVFPVSNSSQSIIDALEKATKANGVEVMMKSGVKQVSKINGGFKVETAKESFQCKNLIVTTGSAPSVWKMMKDLGHSIVSPVPSLFTFNIHDKELHKLSGISFQGARITLPDHGLESVHDLLITHWGLSGPAVLWLSALGARSLHDVGYKFDVHVNWKDLEPAEVMHRVEEARRSTPSRSPHKDNLFELPRRFWQYILSRKHIDERHRWADLTKAQMNGLVHDVSSMPLRVSGKSTFKEEFVTAGGINLKEVDFRNMESKIHSGLYFAGEVLDIDAITGGFNFQACWSEAYAIAQRLKT